MELLRDGHGAERLDAEAQKVLRAGVEAIYHESDAAVRSSRAPRRLARARCATLLLDAAQSDGSRAASPRSRCSPSSTQLCKRQAEYDWLQGEAARRRLPRPPARSARSSASRLLDSHRGRAAARASGLVDEERYGELFDRYVPHVERLGEGEKIRNPHTGDFENPDERMMREVRGAARRPHEARRSPARPRSGPSRRGPSTTLARRSSNAVVFQQPIRKLREAVFTERAQGRGASWSAISSRSSATRRRGRRQGARRRGAREGARVRGAARGAAQERDRALERLHGMGYCDRCALDAASAVLRARFAELVT